MDSGLAGALSHLFHPSRGEIESGIASRLAICNSRHSHRTLTLKLLAVVAGMFVFAVYVMPPLYDLFCEVTGLNGKTGGAYQATEVKVDTSRTIRIQFLATNNENMPWEFEPQMTSIEVHPGQEMEIHYQARNPTGRPMVAQAIPSVVPFKAAEYFHKTECFCFNATGSGGKCRVAAAFYCRSGHSRAGANHHLVLHAV